jgi:hypothetical protein
LGLLLVVLILVGIRMELGGMYYVGVAAAGGRMHVAHHALHAGMPRCGEARPWTAPAPELHAQVRWCYGSLVK